MNMSLTMMIRTIRSTSGDVDSHLAEFIGAEAGPPLSIREARSRLFLISKEVAGGGLRMIRVDAENSILLVRMRDIIEMIAAGSPTIGEALDEMKTRNLSKQ
jgi:hypothetical protein